MVYGDAAAAITAGATAAAAAAPPPQQQLGVQDIVSATGSDKIKSWTL